jgi:long-chain acyl-CoA synthetase
MDSISERLETRVNLLRERSLMQANSIARETLLSYLDDYARRGLETVFVSQRGLRLVRCSYSSLVSYARQTAVELGLRGIHQGDTVILCGENSAEWVVAFWGCLICGVTVVPLERETTIDFARSVQQQIRAKLVFTSRTTVLAKLDVPRVDLDELFDLISSHDSSEVYTDSITPDTLAEVVFTSGTTSAPKGVMLTHANLLSNLLPIEKEISKYLKWERLFHPIRFLNLVPLSHVFGQFMGMFVPQLLGAEVHFHNSLNPAEIVERVRKHRISATVLVPRVLESLRQWLERRNALNGDEEKFKHDISAAIDRTFWQRWWMFRRVHRLFGWKFWSFICGGATLEPQTEEFWQRLGFAVLQGYGMTETASLISVTHPFKDNSGSIGKVMPGYEVKLDDEGEIVVRGPSVSSGYWTPSGQVSRESNQWLQTGDVGTIDESGHLHFKGRKKDVIVTSAGLNVYPEDLEAILNADVDVRSSCVIKWRGTQGDEPLAVLILNNRAANVETIIERANSKLNEHQQIRNWRIWDGPTFPLTGTQKILKREVSATIATSPLEAVGNHSKAGSNFIISEAARITGQPFSENSDPTLKLSTDLKLDSLGRVELLSALEDKYQIEIDEASFTAATSLGEVEQIVRGGLGKRIAPYPYPKWSHHFPITWIRALLFYGIILPITQMMSRLRTEGLENLKKVKEPVLFISNHVTLGDHALILAALPFRLRHRLAIAMEGERLREWLHPRATIGILMRMRLVVEYILVTTFFHVFPLPKKSGFRRSFAYAGESVERGFSVLVFPEGRRAPRGQMHMSPLKSGIGLLASELGIPVVPVKMEGLYELKRRRQYFASKGMVRVRFGEPVRFDRSCEPAKIVKELERRLGAL